MTVVEEIFECSQKIMKEPLGNAASEEIKKRIIDSIFVAYGARNSGPVKIIKSAMLPAKGKHNSKIYFSKREADVGTATFINGSMTRYLDYNDTYLSKEELHPSDNIPPILALSYDLGLNGEQAIKASAVAYQVICALSDSVSIRDRGWDHVTYISISSAAGLASLMGMDSQKFAHTLNLAINNNISLRQTRAGELSMWKGCTAANASRNSVFAAILANSGLTGPAPIFEGEMGFFQAGVRRLQIGPETGQDPQDNDKKLSCRVPCNERGRGCAEPQGKDFRQDSEDRGRDIFCCEQDNNKGP